MVETEVKRVEARTTFEFIGSPLEARTVFADGISGLTVDSSTAKLFLYEKLNGPDGVLVGKVSTNLTLSREGLAQMVDVLTHVLETIRAEEQQTAQK